MIEISLWGNATDLSLLATIKFEDLERLQGKKAILEQQKNIVVNDMEEVFEYFDTLKDAQIDIVLDNAGTAPIPIPIPLPHSYRCCSSSFMQYDVVYDNDVFFLCPQTKLTIATGFELFVDMFLASYLLETNHAKTITLHPKNFGWFVSDVLPSDITSLFVLLEDVSALSSTAAGQADLAFLRERWQRFYEQGRIKVRTDPFWTTAHTFWRMGAFAPEVREVLRGSDLVVYKGDLNYRKLVGDVLSPPLPSLAP